MSLMNTLRNNMKLLLYFIILGFIISLFAGIGTYIMNVRRNTIAVVNKTKISRDNYERLFNNFINTNNDLEKTPENISKIKVEVVQNLMREELLLQQAKKIGISVSNQEIISNIIQYPIFQKNKQFSQAEYLKNLKYVIKQTPTEFENNISKYILTEKTKYFIATTAKLSTAELDFEYETFTAFEKNRNINFNDFMNDFFSKKQQTLFNEWFRSIGSIAETKIYNENL